ncbi:iron-containing alcohol dehydrogenase PsrA [Parapedomonas caeni]
MSQWTFHNPVKIHFGKDAFREISALTRARPYVLVTHPDAAMKPWIEALRASCGAPLLTIDGIEPNPTLDMLARITAQLADSGVSPEMFVALGGGSVIDSTKFLAASGGRFHDLLQAIETGAPLSEQSLPFVAIPTTAGTGSDLTKWATIWDTVGGRKLSLEREDIYAEATIIDPMLTTSLPWPVTLASGLDALSHALESIWNIHASPITRDFAIRATTDIMNALPRLRDNLSDMGARSQLARGALRAGLAFSNTRTAVAHNISYPITLHHGVPHGIACSFCLPDVMIAAIGVDSDCDAALEEIFGDLGDAPFWLRAFLTGLGVPATPHALDIPRDSWRRYVEAAFAGPRGRNFIGSADRFPYAGIQPVSQCGRG